MAPLLLSKKQCGIQGLINANAFRDLDTVFKYNFIDKCKNTYNLDLLWVKHDESHLHYHFFIIGYEGDCRSFIQFINKKYPFGSSARKSIKLSLCNYITRNRINKLNPSVAQYWLTYVKHETSTLYSTKPEKYQKYWDKITDDAAKEAKLLQLERKNLYNERRRKLEENVVCVVSEQLKIQANKKSKFDDNMELLTFIENENITSESALFKLPKDVQVALKTKYTNAIIKDFIEYYANMRNKDAFKYTQTYGEEGNPFRYIILENFLINDGKQGYYINQFLKNPQRFLMGTIILIYSIIHNNIKDKVEFVSTLENMMNQNNGKKNALIFTGVPNSGKSILAHLLTDYVNYGMVSKMSENSNFSLQNIIDKRVVHLEECILNKKYATEYLQLFSRDDNAIVNIKYKDPINLYERSSKPSFILTSNVNPFIHCLDKMNAFKTRSVQYIFENPIKQKTLNECFKIYGKQINLPLTPFHYILLLSLSDNNNLKDPNNFINHIEKYNIIENFKTLIDKKSLKGMTHVELDKLFGISTCNYSFKNTNHINISKINFNKII